MRTVDSIPRLHRDDPVRGTAPAPDQAPLPRLRQRVAAGWRSRRLARPAARAEPDSPQGLIEQVLDSGHRSLFFPRPLERTFQYDIAASRRRLMLVCALIGIASFWGLSSFDREMLAELGPMQAQGRIAIVLTMVGSLAFAFIVPSFARRNWHYEALTFFNTTALNGSLVYAGTLASGVLVLTHTQAVVLVVMYATLVARQRFWWSFMSVAVTTAAYAALVHQTGRPAEAQQIADQNFTFVLVAFAYTLACNYLFEYGERRAWLLRQLDIHKRATLVDTQDRLRLLSCCDALTGLFNRRRFVGDLEVAWQAAQASRQPLAVLMLDVDHFKLYNDTYGHPAGDACLVTIAELLRRHVPDDDGTVARLGGEEFAVLLHPGTPERARVVAEHLCRAIREAGIEHRTSAVEPVVTISVGIAVARPREGDDPAQLLSAADQALYLAKAQGRNCVCEAPGDAASTVAPAVVHDADGGHEPDLQTARPGLHASAAPPPSDAPHPLPAASLLQLKADDLEALLSQGRECSRFPAFIEAAYENQRAPARRKHLFLMSWLGLLCLNAYTFHSRAMFPDVPDQMLPTLLAISCGLGLLTPLLLCPLQGWLRELLYTEGVCTGSAVAVYLLSHSTQTTTLTYLTSLFFLPLFTGVVGRQGVWQSLATSCVTLGAVLLFIEPRDAVQALILRDTLVIVAVGSFYTLIAAYNLDRSARRQWLLREMERLRQIELEDASRTLHELSMKDPLTGLPNRRRFEAECARAWTQAHRDEGAVVALLLIDIDHFKRFNDGYGHPAGDRCLQDVAEILEQVAELAGGLAVRLGGEEFVVLLPQVAEQGAEAIGEQVCIAVRRRNIPHAFSPTDGRLTVSVGLATSGGGQHTTTQLLAAADHALYQAKRAGRDGLVRYQKPDASLVSTNHPAPDEAAGLAFG